MKKISLPPNSALLSEGFIYGVATSSFQIEGERQCRLENIWDKFCDIPGAIDDGSNGDEACKHIVNWERDVSIIEALGVDAYRLSISWPRVIHEDGTPNHAGLNFYVALVKKLVEANIKVFVTLYHWDLPQFLEDKGGWLDRNTIAAFTVYTEIVAKAIGNYVYSFATLNEPLCSAYLGYEVGVHAPGLTGMKNGRQAAHHLLLAHGGAMKVLNTYCPHAKNGIVFNFSNCVANSTQDHDVRAAKIADDYHNQWYIQPVLEGKYPALLQDLPIEQRPDILPGDMAIIKQPVDFIGVNYYTRTTYESDGAQWFKEVVPTSGALTAMGWEICPDAFYQQLMDLHRRYDLPPVYITENGAAMNDRFVDGVVNDEDRIAYFHSHLNAVHKAVEEGMLIQGYFAWSLMDNFEWAMGYTKRFGIIYVDYATQQRTLKQSAKAYRDFICARNFY